MAPRKSQRRQQILEALAQMLEANPGSRITTAGLARQVGVSEAALYRHFPSKSKMFEGLIDFIEDTLFSRISIILNEERTATLRCEKMLMLLLAFAERNPGITRILTGDALAGETERLHTRVAQLYDRFETQLKQVIREAEMREGLRPAIPLPAAANLLMATAEGRISQYVRSGFRRSPTADWPAQWEQLMRGFFKDAISQAIPGQTRPDQASSLAG
jgi:TetR/AcrR family transcriptional regulator